MKLRFLKLALLLSLSVSGSSLLAADGSSGCGPGWYVFKKNSLVSSSLRGITNGLLAPVVTVGMTFGTSNCSRHSIVMRDKEVERFIAHNYSPVQHEASQGQGEHLAVIGHMYECDNTGRDVLKQTVQQNYGYLFDGDRDSYEVTARLNDLVYYNAALQSHCAMI